MVAVVCYFLFRCVSSFSDTIAQGFLLALPLVTIACIIRAAKPADEGDAPALGEGTQALQVLVAVAAAFAIGCSVTVYLAGRENDVLSSGLNYMVLFEVLAVILMAFCCWLMSRFSQQRGALSPRGTALLTLPAYAGVGFAGFLIACAIAFFGTMICTYLFGFDDSMIDNA